MSTGDPDAALRSAIAALTDGTFVERTDETVEVFVESSAAAQH